MVTASSQGFFAYHAVPTNMSALVVFRRRVTELWWRTLKQRSQRDKTTWQRARKIANDWLPKPKILHPWPSDRFAVKHPRWEPYAGKLHVRICAGALSNGRPYRARHWTYPVALKAYAYRMKRLDGQAPYAFHFIAPCRPLPHIGGLIPSFSA
jgi:hypothetical protein